MKIPKFLLGILVVFSAILLFPISKPQAAEFHFKEYKLEQGKTVRDDLYIFSPNAEINGIVDGDVVVFAERVSIKGTITGDVYAGGSTIDIDATIYGNLFLMGSHITSDGLMNGNLYAFANNFSSLGQIGKDALSFTFSSTFKGSVGDDLRVFGFTQKVDAMVGGDLLAFGEQVTVSENKITGKIYNKKTVDDIASEQGAGSEETVESNFFTKLFAENSLASKAIRGFFSFLTMLLAGSFLLWLTPVKNVQIKRKIIDTPSEFVKSLLIGLCTFLIVPIPLTLLLISIIGAPIALIVIAFLIFVVIFGRIWTELAIGSEILTVFGVKEYRPYRSFLIGRVISVLIGFVPVISGFYSIILILTSLGAIIRMKKDFFTIAKRNSKLPVINKEKIVKKKVATKKK